MAQDLTAFNAEYWTPTMQETFLKESVALGIANVETRADLKDGDTLHKPYGSYPRVQTYSKTADISVKDLSSTDDYLTVNTAKVASFYVDNIDTVQNKYDVIKEFATMAQKQLNNVLDQAVLSEYTNAGKTLGGLDIGEADGGIVFSPSNCSNVFTAAGATLNGKKRLSMDRFALIGPRMLQVIQNYVGGRETTFGDYIGDNGQIASRFGFGLKMSNNLPFTATFDMDTILVDTDTVSIAGVTFTADADGAAVGAGHFSIQDNAANCAISLAAAINGTGTPGVDTYIELSAEDRQLIEEAGIVATIDGTNLVITGFGDIVVSTSNSASAAWSAVYQYALMGINKSIDLLTQVEPNVIFRPAQLRLGQYVHPWMLYGKKTFTRNQSGLVAVKFDASAWV